MKCLFCKKDQSELLFENEYGKAFFDHYPVNEGHILIVPKEHRLNYFELSSEEINAIHELIHRCKDYLTETYYAEGFNIGWNCGEEAGQTIFHAHCHLMPRYKGDVDNPKGGIRNFKKALVEY